MMLTLPYPISANRYWQTRVIKGKNLAITYVSPEAKAYKEYVARLAQLAGMQILDGDVSVSYVLHPRLTMQGVASKSRCDLDNVLKVIGDALNGVAWTDDKQIVEIHARIGLPIKDGGISITISKAIPVRQ